jgi:hypothetical protein
MRSRWLALACLLSASAGCDDDDGLVRVPDPPVQVDELKQKVAAVVDILWVVDNSESMVQEQVSLATNFDRFITGLTTCQGTNTANDVCDFVTKTCKVSGAPCNPPDYHIGVISTDVFNAFDQGKLRRVGLCVPAVGATPSNSKYRYCLSTNQECAPDASDPNSDPSNSICDVTEPLSFVTATTPGAAAAFSRAVRVGVGGSGRESGIQAAAQAVGRDTDRSNGTWIPAPAMNTGFLRPDASLFLIFVSDEDDASFGEVSYFYRAFETLKGAGNEGVISVSAIVGDPDIDGPMGPERGGCPIAPAEATAAAGTRYVALSMYSRGLSAEFRVCDNARLTCADGQACKRPINELPGICVPSTCSVDQDCGNFQCGDRGCVTCENAACALPSDRFLNLLSDTGVFGSICEPDYGTVLGSLGFEAAGLARKFALTKFPDCGKSVPCCAPGVSDDACTTTVPVCVRVNGEILPNDRATGWVYDASANSVFFDGSFVPPTDATIAVSYTRAPGDTALACDANLQ